MSTKSQRWQCSRTNGQHIGERKISTTPINGDLPKFTGTNPATPRAERMTELCRLDAKRSSGTAVERHSQESQPRKKARIAASLETTGAGTRIRTGDLLITNQLLYQLSYAGEGRGF
jgi:hypothetical protein